MQLFPLLLIVIVLAADGGIRLFQQWSLTPVQSTLAAVVPVISVVGVVWLVVALCDRRLTRQRAAGAIHTADRAVRFARLFLLVNHAAAVLCFGWLDAIRAVMGDLILLDELIAIAPPLLGAIALWWVHYPIERRVRESLLVRRLDLGRPVYAMPARLPYVLLQIRTGLLIILAPIILILALGEAIQLAAAQFADGAAAEVIASGATLAAAAAVFLCAPLLMRLLLNVEPLAAGPLRDDLLDICRTHKVRVRNLLLWKTSGTMINAAVMGIVGRLRYVLVTDALIESMTEEQLKAVMAHEVGHVRRHHMPWLVVCFAAVLFAALWIVELPVIGLRSLGVLSDQPIGDVLMTSLMVLQLIIALLAFGWVSRRFERQADTFAVQHLSGLARAGQAPDEISMPAVSAMSGALATIAHLNAVDPRRPSWRHGSIAWRQNYLLSIMGKHPDELAIDRSIKRIKRLAAAVLAVTLVAWLLIQL